MCPVGGIRGIREIRGIRVIKGIRVVWRSSVSSVSGIEIIRSHTPSKPSRSSSRRGSW